MAESTSRAEKRASLRSTASANSATRAMQRAANTMIAITEAFRSQFREREDSITQSPEGYDVEGGPPNNLVPHTPRPSGDHRGGQLTAAFQSSPGRTEESDRPSNGNSISRSTTRKESPPLPPLPGELASVVSSPVPAAIEGYPHPEPATAQIEQLTPTSSGSSAKSVPRTSRTAEPPLPPLPVELPAHTGSMSTITHFPTQGGLRTTSLGSNANMDLVEASHRFQTYRPSGGHTPRVSRQGTTAREQADEFRRSVAPFEIALKVPPPPPPKSKWDEGKPSFSLAHEIFFVIVLCLAQLLMFAALAQALVPAQAISNSFSRTKTGYATWYTAAYGLTAGAFALPAGRLGHLFGLKKIFIYGFLWFSLWSILAGLSVMVQKGRANGLIYFCVCRAMQGIGPALILPNAQALLTKQYDLGPRRNLVMVFFGMAAPLGFVLGAVMASLFAVIGAWEWAFYVLGAVCVTLAVQSVLILPADSSPTKAMGVKYWSLLDAGGIILCVSGLVLVAFAWTQAPLVSWTTPYIYFLLLIGALLCAGFVYNERVVAHPLLPMATVNPTTVFVLACTAAAWGCFSVWIFYSFQFIIQLRGWTPLLSSAGFAHMPIAGLAASILVAYLLRRVTPYWVMLLAMAAFVTGSSLMATAPVGQIYWINTFLSILFMPFGMNMSNPVATILVSNAVPPQHRDITASLVTGAIFYSISVSLGMAGTIETNVNKGGRDVLGGYRAAQYFGLGLGVLGFVLALMFAVVDWVWPADPDEGAALHLGRKVNAVEKKPRGLATASPGD